MRHVRYLESGSSFRGKSEYRIANKEFRMMKSASRYVLPSFCLPLLLKIEGASFLRNSAVPCSIFDIQ